MPTNTIAAQLLRRLQRFAGALTPLTDRGSTSWGTLTCGGGQKNAANWDQYWADILRAPKRIRDYQCGISGAIWVRELVEKLHRRHATRLLFVGNGISLVPWAFAHAGFRAVVLDVSPVATDYLARTTIDEEQLRSFFRLNELVGKPSFHELHRDGGSVEVVCGDMLDSQFAPGPFDAAFAERSLQGFSTEELPRAAAAISARLTESAECHVWVQNSGEALDRIASAFGTLGYQRIEGLEDVADPPNRTLHLRLASG